MSGSTPNRCYLIRLRVNEERNGIEILPVGENGGAGQTGPVDVDWDAILGE